MAVKSPPTEAVDLPWNDKFLARCFIIILPDRQWPDGKLVRVRTSELIEFTGEVLCQYSFATIQKITPNLVQLHSGHKDAQYALTAMAQAYANRGYNLINQRFTAYQIFRHDDPDDTP